MYYQAISAENVDSLGATILLDTTVTICQGDEFWGYDESGIYTDTTVSNDTCTITTLELIVHEATPNQTELICILANDPNYTPGTYVENLIDSNGCNYQLVTSVRIKPADVITNISICDGETFTIWDSITITQSGTYSIEAYDMGPCPYQQILNVTVLPTTPDITTTAQICDGDFFTWNGNDYFDTGFYSYIKFDSNGCDCYEYLDLTVVPNDECITVDVIVFEDLNGDCLYDPQEPHLNNIRVNMDDKIYRLTTVNGKATFYPRKGTHTFTAEVNPLLYSSCNNMQLIDLEQDEYTMYIPIEVLEKCADLSIGATIPRLRRCFKNVYHIELVNEGTIASEDARVSIIMDPFFEEIESDMELLSVQDSVYTYLVDAIAPNEIIQKKINFTLSCDADLGQEHYLTAKLDYANACSFLSDTLQVFECRMNIGSYDPNDKSSYINGLADKDVLGENDELEYLIRFQNTGTDTAFTVRIEDVLSTDLDLSSVIPVSASHDYEWFIERDRNLVVTFNDILLVDSTTNEKGSHGFIKFKVDLRDQRPEPGAIVNNTAAIFFDFNEPIITNTVETYYKCKHTNSVISTTICEGEDYEGYIESGEYVDNYITDLGCDSMRTLILEVLPVSEADCFTGTAELANYSLQLYPNPVQGVLFLNYEGRSDIKSYRFYNLSGTMVKEAKLNGNNNNHIISTDELVDGMYLIKLVLENGKSLEKRIVIVK